MEEVNDQEIKQEVVAENIEEEISGPTQSPTASSRKLEVKTLLNFYDALREVMDGKKITKEEWNNPEYYGVLDNTFLKLHKPDGKLYSWILNDGDINGTDYVIIN